MLAANSTSQVAASHWQPCSHTRAFVSRRQQVTELREVSTSRLDTLTSQRFPMWVATITLSHYIPQPCTWAKQPSCFLTRKPFTVNVSIHAPAWPPQKNTPTLLCNCCVSTICHALLRRGCSMNNGIPMLWHNPAKSREYCLEVPQG